MANITATKLEKDRKILKWIIDQKGFHMDHELQQCGNVTIRQQTALGLQLGQFAQLANPHQSSNIWSFVFWLLCAYCIGANSIATKLFMVLIFSSFLNIGTTYLVNSLILLIPKYNNIQ